MLESAEKARIMAEDKRIPDSSCIKERVWSCASRFVPRRLHKASVEVVDMTDENKETKEAHDGGRWTEA